MRPGHHTAPAQRPDFVLASVSWPSMPDVLRELPMEFAVEAQKLLGVSLEGSVG